MVVRFRIAFFEDPLPWQDLCHSWYLLLCWLWRHVQELNSKLFVSYWWSFFEFTSFFEIQETSEIPDHTVSSYSTLIPSCTRVSIGRIMPWNTGCGGALLIFWPLGSKMLVEIVFMSAPQDIWPKVRALQWQRLMRLDPQPHCGSVSNTITLAERQSHHLTPKRLTCHKIQIWAEVAVKQVTSCILPAFRGSWGQSEIPGYGASTWRTPWTLGGCCFFHDIVRLNSTLWIQCAPTATWRRTRTELMLKPNSCLNWIPWFHDSHHIWTGRKLYQQRKFKRQTLYSIHACMHTSMHPYIHPCIPTSMHPYIQTSTHPSIHAADRQTDRHTCIRILHTYIPYITLHNITKHYITYKTLHNMTLHSIT